MKHLRPTQHEHGIGPLFDLVQTQHKKGDEYMEFNDIKTLSGLKKLRQVPDTSEGSTEMSATCCGFENRHEESGSAHNFSADFDGATYEPEFDADRLRGEMARVYSIMKDGHWRTLCEINLSIQYSYFGKQDPEAGISARLRDLRKAKFGSHTVNRRRRGDPRRGLFEYQLII